MRHIQFLLLAATVVMSVSFASAQSASQPAAHASDPALAQKVQELRTQHALLIERLEAVERELAELEEQNGEVEAPLQDVPPAGATGFVRRGADKSALARIRLPENPTRDQVIAYVQQIIAVTRPQNSFNSDDPQIRMLTAVGSEHLDVLLMAAPQMSFYTISAITQLAGPEHREMILKTLPEAPELASVVIAKQWQKHAREALLAPLSSPQLRHHRYLPPAWIRAVAMLEDPATYPALEGFLIYGANRHITYDTIWQLPGIELDDAVRDAWSRACGDPYEANSLAHIAASHGVKDALAVVVRNATAKGASMASPEQQDNWRTVRLVLPFDGQPDELKTWFRQHKAQLAWSPSERQFVLAPTTIPSTQP